MRVGDFGLEIVGVTGDVREIDTGHVLARPGVVYAIRLRNHGPLRCVINVALDGKAVTRNGLVLDAYAVCTLERPVDDHEHGRFTVVAEGDERVFGPDGGRDNPELGLIEAAFRRELPSVRPEFPSLESTEAVPSRPMSWPGAPGRPRPMAPPEWVPPGLRPGAMNRDELPDIQAMAVLREPTARPGRRLSSEIERAAGTGLTGRSDQEFVQAVVGPLEPQETTLRLRLVIATPEAIASPRPLPDTTAAPARPAARP
jgi:hypothetical protein